LSCFIIADKAQEQWIQCFLEISPLVPPTLMTIIDLDQEAHQITDDIEETSMQVFKVWKGYSPRGLAWWNNDCNLAVTGLQEAPDLETYKVANKNLCKVVATAKHCWANKFLHNPTLEQLWIVAKWHFGHRQRLILALITDTGLSNQLAQMTMALKKHFFKMISSEVPATFPDDPPAHAPHPHNMITESEITDALHPMSDKSVPGPLGHNYKLV
jgi:hypothetical protein